MENPFVKINRSVIRNTDNSLNRLIPFSITGLGLITLSLNSNLTSNILKVLHPFAFNVGVIIFSLVVISALMVKMIAYFLNNQLSLLEYWTEQGLIGELRIEKVILINNYIEFLIWIVDLIFFGILTSVYMLVYSFTPFDLCIGISFALVCFFLAVLFLFLIIYKNRNLRPFLNKKTSELMAQAAEDIITGKYLKLEIDEETQMMRAVPNPGFGKKEIN